MRKHLRREEREEHLEKWRTGGMSKNAYALKAGINPRTFIGWTWQEAKKKDTGFIEIPKKAFTRCFSEMVIEKDGVIIRVPMSVRLQELQTVFTALGGAQ